MPVMIQAMEHILKQDKSKERYLEEDGLLTRAFALSVPYEEAMKIRDDVGFFQPVRAAIIEITG
jgi:type I restriction enzyme, R subunit